jgi:hypothetical protein
MKGNAALVGPSTPLWLPTPMQRHVDRFTKVSREKPRAFMPGIDRAEAKGFLSSGCFANRCIKSQPMALKNKPDTPDAKDERGSVLMLRQRIKDKHATYCGR